MKNKREYTKENYLVNGTKSQNNNSKMKKLDTLLNRDVAKKMIIDGESWEKIMDTTHLRLKDLKRIQRDEIDPKF